MRTAPDAIEGAPDGTPPAASRESLPVAPSGGQPTSSASSGGVGSPEPVPGDLRSYHGLVAHMLFAEPSRRYALALTSALPGEGVTVVAAGIAQALAERTHKDVLLVDANLRRPAVHRYFASRGSGGLGRLILGTSGVPVRTSPPNLHVLADEATWPNPSRLLTSERLCHVVADLRSSFDFVVFDCPAVREDVDSVQLCRLADGVALVVRAGVTPREQVVLARETLREANVVGLVLSRA